MHEIRPLRAEDRAAWEVLARGYKAFYQTPTTDADFELVWRRLMRGADAHGLVAHRAGAIVGIAQYVFHPNVWSDDLCYLQDLFVSEAARGQGVARALIENVAMVARSRGAPRLYWLTHENNSQARALYDRVANFHGFIRYDYLLGPR